MGILSEYRLCDHLDSKFKENIKYAYITKRDILCISNDKKVYKFGIDKFKTLRYTYHHDACVVDTKIIEQLSNKEIKKFSDGSNYMMALDEDGNVYSWGSNIYGQLGIGKITDYEEINLIEYSKFENNLIDDICCGFNHTLALSKKGKVFAWGNNEFGQLGLGSEVKNEIEPKLLKSFVREKVIAISCGGQHSLALTKSRRVFSWGDNSFGQLGFENCNKLYEPKPIEIVTESFSKIICGAMHSLLLSTKGSIRAFGNNENGQIGNNCFIHQYIPTYIWGDIVFEDITTTIWHNISMASTKLNLFFIWGKCGNETFSVPEKTEFKSFNDILAHFYELSYGMIEPKIQAESVNGYFDREFTQTKYIDEGSYGIVYKAERKTKDKGLYAIKITNPLENSEREEILKEIETLHKLDTNFVVRYYNSWFEDDFILKNDVKTYNSNKFSLYIQMELCAGSLEKLMNEIKEYFKLKANDLLLSLHYFIHCKIFEELIECVKYLHEEKQIHRDLRPANVLISAKTDDRFFKLGDFGLVTRHMSENQQHRDVADLAALKYIAPEVLNREKHNEKADIFSLGIMMEESFRIDKYDENFKRETKIDSIFENLKELVQRMLIGRNSKGQTDYNSRPNCEGILVKKNNWSLDLHELEIDESLKEIDKNLEFKMKFQNSLLLKYMKYLKSKIKPEIFNSRLKEEFSVFEELGAGCFGRVYKAQHKLDKQIYAIKKIDVANFYWEKEFTSKRATKEIAIMAKIQSDYIVHYITSWIERQVVYIQMEFCDENLDETIRYIKNYLLSKNKRILSQIGFCIASEIFKQINKGLQFLHEHNPPIIHRDLKPFNILLKYDGRKKFIRIADFAIATYHKYDGQLHMQDVGTINYMAPEVESGNYDTRADIYSLGRILKELFVIDFNSKSYQDEENIPRMIMVKYEALLKLCLSMLEMRFNERPTCKKILEYQSSWALGVNEFEFEKELAKAKNSFKESKLLSIFENQLKRNQAKKTNNNFLMNLFTRILWRT